MAGVIVLIAFLGVFGGMGFMVMKTLKKTDATMGGVAADTAALKTAQEFLPFERIQDGVLDLGGFKYRMIIECSSLNYALKTEMEQEMIEMAFQRNLNAFLFPYTIFVQTREIDNRKMLESLKEDTLQTIEVFPQLSDYGNLFYSEMTQLTETLQNTKQKKKYLIIPYDDAATLTNLNKNEKFEYASKELYARTVMVRDAMQSIGLKATILDDAGLIELLHSTFNKDDYSDTENIASGEYLSSLVEGVFYDRETDRNLIGNRIAHTNPFKKLELILYQAQKQIQNEVLTTATDDDEDALYGAVIQMVGDIRDRAEEAYLEMTEGGENDGEE